MQKPEMILFDYGHTLYDESNFDALKGSRAVLALAIDNPEGVTPETLVKKANEMNAFLGRYKEDKVKDCLAEFHNLPFTRYLYEYFNLTFDRSLTDIETIYWDNAAPGVATKHIHVLLEYLKESGIRVGVISNLSFSGKALVKRISQEIDVTQFEFILSTAEYIFRKPSPYIYEIALKKAGLKAEQVWYCGDNVHCDVEGSRAVGIQPVWYRGANPTGVYNGIADKVVIPESPNCDHLVFDDWLQMMDVLKGLW